MIMKRKRGIVFCVIIVAFLVMAAGCNFFGKGKEKSGPKYIFLFIGDGMGYSQIQLASDYLGSVENADFVQIEPLSFMSFPVTGSLINYDLTSYIPDSASSGTAIASGKKTTTGTINKDKLEDISFETIAEYLKINFNYKIGIVSSANINHTTPATFYAHRDSRAEEYKIGLEIINSNFDYFGGGGMRSETEEEIQELYNLSESAGYQIVESNQAFIDTLRGKKSIIIASEQAEEHSLPYAIDAGDDSWKLKNYVASGIDLLENKTGFFMMAEGGKIDWACHSNDTATCVQEVLDFNEAVKTAVSFYRKYPEDTLILVTADHETGGLTLGNQESGYMTNFYILKNQNISFRKFEDDYVETYKKNQTSFDEAAKDIEELFGLEQDKEAAENIEMVLTESQLHELKAAYEATLSLGADTQQKLTEEQYLLYGKYDPLTITILRIMSEKAGVSWSAFAHTASVVPIFALGNGADEFGGYYDNTKLYQKIKELVN